MAVAQALAEEEAIADARDRWLRRVAACLLDSHPGMPQREVARWLVTARRACLRETLDGD